MPNSFNANDPGKKEGNQGTSFNDQTPSGDPQGKGGEGDQSNIDIKTLQKRFDDSQAFIELLKEERQADRAMMEELKNKAPVFDIDEIVEKVNQSKGTQDNSVHPDELVNKVYEQVTSRMTNQQKEAAEATNFNQVAETLRKQFGGDQVDTKVSELAEQSGMAFDDVIDLAKRSPKAVYKLLGITQTPAAQSAPSQGSHNTSAFSQPTETKLPNILEAKSDRSRVDLFNKKMADRLAKLN